MKNLLKMSDLTPGELTHILDVADQLKAQQKLGGTAPLLAGKTVAMLFSKASTRTRTSFEVGVYQLGGLGNYMNTSELQAGRGAQLYAGRQKLHAERPLHHPGNAALFQSEMGQAQR